MTLKDVKKVLKAEKEFLVEIYAEGMVADDFTGEDYSKGVFEKLIKKEKKR
jgi:hypothetical protein